VNRGKGPAFFIFVLFVFLCLIPVGAQEKRATTKGDKKGFGLSGSRAPIDITSDTVEADQKQNTVTFKGNVFAKQEDSNLYADTLTIRYDSVSKRVKEMVAVGNVKIVQLERRATGHKAIFQQDENKVILEGEAVLWEGENVIRGERIIHFVEEERSIVEAGKGGRVTTHITPSKSEEKKK